MFFVVVVCLSVFFVVVCLFVFLFCCCCLFVLLLLFCCCCLFVCFVVVFVCLFSSSCFVCCTNKAQPATWRPRSTVLIFGFSRAGAHALRYRSSLIVFSFCLFVFWGVLLLSFVCLSFGVFFCCCLLFVCLLLFLLLFPRMFTGAAGF